MFSKILIVTSPVLVALISTILWLWAWGVFKLDENGLSIDNIQDWEDSGVIPENRSKEGYPVFTLRTLAVNALGIPTVFFLGSIFAMQFIRRGILQA